MPASRPSDLLVAPITEFLPGTAKRDTGRARGTSSSNACPRAYTSRSEISVNSIDISPYRCDNRYLALVRKRIAKAEHITGLVVFPLDRVLRAPVIEAEHFVGQIEARHDQMQPAVHPETCLCVHLGVAVQIGISVWPLDSQWHRIRRPIRIQVLVVVAEDVRVVVRNTQRADTRPRSYVGLIFHELGACRGSAGVSVPSGTPVVVECVYP